MYCYRPNEFVAKVIFLHLFVILFTGGCLPQCMPQCPREQTPPQEQTPPREQTPPWEQTPPPGRHTSQEQTPPPRSRPPQSRHPSGIRSMSGRYASYWNAFLFYLLIYWSRFTSIVKSPAFNGTYSDTVHVRFHYMWNCSKRFAFTFTSCEQTPITNVRGPFHTIV